MDNELLLFDRINVIKDTIQKYGEENFYLSFSGGKDSTILHYLLDQALPNNKIPRVFMDTGIEYNLIRQFVLDLAKNDERFVIIKPTQAIRPMLENNGYPFKSKEFSGRVDIYTRNVEVIDKYKNMPTEKLKSFMLSHKELEKELNGKGMFIVYYLHNIRAIRDKKGYIANYQDAPKFSCPQKLKYLFDQQNPLKISSKCCNKLKKEPAKKWAKENGKSIIMTGMRAEEGGQRANIKGCILTDKDGNITKFHPLIKVDDQWEEWFVHELESERGGHILCELYYPPYNFRRTGCKGCPYTLDLQEQLEIMDKLLPNERKQCEIIWKPVYDEYRKLNYRLKKVEKVRLF